MNTEHKQSLFVSSAAPVIAVAPMMGWTDRHCRFFHRLLAPSALLYTEMITAAALLYGNAATLLEFSPEEQPVALQLGGADPAALARAAEIGAAAGYSEINLNVGCPSDRVQSGRFGACLMREPTLVAKCVAALKATVQLPVTVKCRLGVDDQDGTETLTEFATHVFDSGADALWVHARKAWLQGLSPKENRHIPPLCHDRVYRLKEEFPTQWIGINGGISRLQEARTHLAFVDGVMIGRAAYQNPALLGKVNTLLDAGQRDMRATTEDLPEKTLTSSPAEQKEAVLRFLPYLLAQTAQGVPLRKMTSCLLGLFQGVRGVKLWRQRLAALEINASPLEEQLRWALAALIF